MPFIVQGLDTLLIDIGFAPFVNTRNFGLFDAFTLTLLDNGSLKLCHSPKDRQIQFGCTIRTLWRESEVAGGEGHDVRAVRTKVLAFCWS